MPNQNIDKKKKLYFLAFIGLTLVILIIFGFIIFTPFWDYVQSLKQMDKYYRGKLENIVQYIPKINWTDPIKGTTDAKVTIFEYSDFVCPACKNLQTDLAAIEKLYGNRIRIVYKGLPISLHPENRLALNSAYCAWEQNYFWPYKDLLYQNNEALSNARYQQLAKELNLNLETFNKCLSENKYTEVIEQNLAEAIAMQINSIPTIYVNEQKVQGILNYNSLKKIIDQKLANQ